MIDGSHIGQIDNVINRAVSRIQGLQILHRNQIGFSSIRFTIADAVCLIGSDQQVRLPSPSTSPAEETE